MDFGGALARAIIAQVVDVDAVDYVRDATLARDFIQAGEELIFAVETAVAIVFEVIGIFEFARFDVFVANAVGARELLCVALMRFGE